MTVAVDRTSEVLKEMMTENTGKHFLDSGGAYGRNWERNQGRDFDSEPEASLEVEVWDLNGEQAVWLNLTISTYHFLNRNLLFDQEMDDEFNRFVEERGEEYDSWFTEVGEFIEHLQGQGRLDSQEVYTENTYNGDSFLSQIFQYTYWVDYKYEDQFILLSIHGGCDVRGGYTKPRVFRVMEEYANLTVNHSRATLICERSIPDEQSMMFEIDTTPHYWDVYPDGTYYDGFMNGVKLEDHEINQVESPKDWVQGTLTVVDDGENDAYILCPICGSQLNAYM